MHKEAGGGLRFNRLLINHSEISTKKGNRRFFEEQLASNIARKIGRAGYRWIVDTKRHYHLVHIPGSSGIEEINDVIRLISEVNGVQWVAPAIWYPASDFRQKDHTPDYELIRKHVLELARHYYQPGESFAVKVVRSEKQHTLPSDQLERWLGAEINEHTDWEKVDLTTPDRRFRVRIYVKDLFIIPERTAGPGGLPVGSAGQAITLLSGGFDSPIAAWLMARRGCHIDFIHFTASHPHPEFFADSKMDRLCRWLSRFTLSSRLYLIPYTYFDMAIPDHNRPQALMVFRRFMSRTAERLAGEIGAKALITGDSLSQVASQTLENLVANYQSISMPVMQPLIGYEKDEIVQLSRTIGSYELSVEPYKDCCSLISQNPETKAKPHILENFEKKWIPDYEGLIEQSLNDGWCMYYECGNQIGSVSLSEDRMLQESE